MSDNESSSWESFGDDPQLHQLIEEYAAALAAGTPVSRDRLLDAHPAEAPRLAAALDALDQLHAAGPAVRASHRSLPKCVRKKAVPRPRAPKVGLRRPPDAPPTSRPGGSPTAANITAAWPGWAFRWRTRSITHTRTAFCIATSSRATCCSM